jgi:hypothetical protein
MATFSGRFLKGGSVEFRAKKSGLKTCVIMASNDTGKEPDESGKH